MTDSEIKQEGLPPSLGSQGDDRFSLAEQELRLISALVLLIGIGLFLALPFVLSIAREQSHADGVYVAPAAHGPAS